MFSKPFTNRPGRLSARNVLKLLPSKKSSADTSKAPPRAATARMDVKDSDDRLAITPIPQAMPESVFSDEIAIWLMNTPSLSFLPSLTSLDESDDESDGCDIASDSSSDMRVGGPCRLVTIQEEDEEDDDTLHPAFACQGGCDKALQSISSDSEDLLGESDKSMSIASLSQNEQGSHDYLIPPVNSIQFAARQEISATSTVDSVYLLIMITVASWVLRGIDDARNGLQVLLASLVAIVASLQSAAQFVAALPTRVCQRTITIYHNFHDMVCSVIVYLHILSRLFQAVKRYTEDKPRPQPKPKVVVRTPPKGFSPPNFVALVIITIFKRALQGFIAFLVILTCGMRMGFSFWIMFPCAFLIGMCPLFELMPKDDEGGVRKTVPS